MRNKPRQQAPTGDASKQFLALAGALELAQTQQREDYEEEMKQLRNEQADELDNWRAEFQAREGLYMERIARLENEVGKLCKELIETKLAI